MNLESKAGEVIQALAICAYLSVRWGFMWMLEKGLC